MSKPGNFDYICALSIFTPNIPYYSKDVSTV